MNAEKRIRDTIRIYILGTEELKKAIIFNNIKLDFMKESYNIYDHIHDFLFDLKNGIRIKICLSAEYKENNNINAFINALRNKDYVILTFDLTNKKSFELVKNCMKELREKMLQNPNAVVIGNRYNQNEYEIVPDDAKKLANDHGLKYFNSFSDNDLKETMEEIFKDAYEYKCSRKNNKSKKKEENQEENQEILLKHEGDAKKGKGDNGEKEKKCCSENNCLIN